MTGNERINDIGVVTTVQGHGQSTAKAKFWLRHGHDPSDV
jgi:hypothetical protein